MRHKRDIIGGAEPTGRSAREVVPMDRSRTVARCGKARLSAALASEGCSRRSFLFSAAVSDALYPQIRKHNTPPFAPLMNILI